MQENQSNNKLDQKSWEEFLGYDVWIEQGMFANKAKTCRYECVDWGVIEGTGYGLMSS